MTMNLKLFVIHVPVGIMILSLMLFGHIFTEAAALVAVSATKDQTDTEVEDKEAKQESGTSETKANNDDNTGKDQEEAEGDEDEEQQESNDDTRATEGELEEDNVMIDDADTYSNKDGDENNGDDDIDVPFELPFDDIIPFP